MEMQASMREQAQISMKERKNLNFVPQDSQIEKNPGQQIAGQVPISIESDISLRTSSSEDSMDL